MGQGRSWLVAPLFASVQIAIERMGFGHRGRWRCLQKAGGVIDVSTFDRKLAQLPRETIALSLWHVCCQKGTPFPPTPSCSVAGTPHNFSPLFCLRGFCYFFTRGI